MANTIITNPTINDKMALYENLLERTNNLKNNVEIIVNELNNIEKFNAIRKITNGEKVNNMALMLGVKYLFINFNNVSDPEKAIAEKTIKASDIYCIKKTKNSNKIEIPQTLYSCLEMFGGNLSTEYLTTKSDAIALLNVYCKFANIDNVFTSESPSSVNSLEKQLQVIFNTLFTDEKAPKARKMYVRHLSDSFTKVIKTGYKNGNALNLLQLVIEHANDCNFNRSYSVNSNLAIHKEVKEKTTTKAENVPDRV